MVRTLESHKCGTTTGTPVETDDVCLVIPVYNESAVIADVVTAARAVYPWVVCVDDGSTDDSAVLSAGAGALVVRHPVNLGQGAALQTGVEFVLAALPSASYLVTFDGDGQHQVGDVAALVAYAREFDVDVVLGSRFLSERSSIPRCRRVLLRAAVSFTRTTTGLRLTDAHNGLRLFTRDAARRLGLRLTGMAHASEILHVIAQERLRHAEVPVHVLYTEYSRAKGQSSVNAVNIAFELATHRLRPAR